MPYRMPAEWEPHEGTWMAWPHNLSHWPGKFEPIPKVYAQIIRALTQSEPVFLCVNDAEAEREARRCFEEGGVTLGAVEFVHIPTNASWSRDHGPMFVRTPEGWAVLDWDYNGNGDKWKPYDLDDAVPTKVAELLELPVLIPGVVLEGGSIDVNGKGTLLTTESCLLNPNRNPRLNREQIEGYLREYIGVTNILWLKEGIAGDDTDGHIDDLARFVNPTTVVCPLTQDTADADYAILQQNYRDLQKMRDQDKRPLTVVPLPTPTPVVYKNERLPASYANFYIANTVVLVPTFNCPQDAQALAILQRFFPNRRVIGIDCVDLVWGFGTLHCSTQQQPAMGN
ncbi:MAG: agmatine deiminase family protein [Patescibacteria group bacterium]|nr:agmatine deiminase family protein [Patescibacteria group bacterium]